METFFRQRSCSAADQDYKTKKSGEGKIITFKAFALLQINIYVVLKYAKQNKSYGYVLAIMDVFANGFFIQ